MEQGGLLFPKVFRKRTKKGKTKKNKIVRHRASILHCETSETCFLCAQLHDDWREHTFLHTHHVFGASNRKHSTEYGLTVKLCLQHHTEGPEAVHKNAEIRKKLQDLGQRTFEEKYPDLDFVKIFGKNYKI